MGTELPCSWRRSYHRVAMAQDPLLPLHGVWGCQAAPAPRCKELTIWESEGWEKRRLWLCTAVKTGSRVPVLPPRPTKYKMAAFSVEQRLKAGPFLLPGERTEQLGCRIPLFFFFSFSNYYVIPHAKELLLFICWTASERENETICAHTLSP